MPSISRRRFLAAGGVGAAGLVGGGALLPVSYLPDSLAVRRIQYDDVPEFDPRPPVTESHEAASVDDFRALVDRAEAVWKRAEQLGPDTWEDTISPETSLRGARGHLESAEENLGWDALFSARYGTQFAGNAIGASRYALGEASGEQMADRARDIQSAVEAERDRIAHEFDDLSTGFARLWWVEKWLLHARLNAYRNGTYTGQREPTTEYERHDFEETWGAQMTARQFRRDATRLYDDYRDGLDDPRDYTDHVEAVDERLYDEAVERSFTRDEFERRHETIEALPEGPYKAFRWAMMYYLQTADVRSPDRLEAGLPAYRAVRNAEVVLQGRAFEAVRNDERISAGDDSVSLSTLDRTKREGLALLDERTDATADRPVYELLVREGRRLLWTGNSRLGDDVEYPRARALKSFHLGVEYLRHVDDVASILDRPSTE